ncbi:hypothetical protein ACLKA7_001341 [Drosophila subpalustris]
MLLRDNCYIAPSFSHNEYTLLRNDLALGTRDMSLVLTVSDFDAWVTDWGSSRTTPRVYVLYVKKETWVEQFLQEELGKFEGLTGVSHIAEHAITLRDNRPIKQRYYPKNPAMQKIINDQVDELLKDNRIEPSRSPHSAPIGLVRMKDW